MLEKNIEKMVCDFATKKGVVCYKFESPSNNGVPDRIYLFKGKVLFIEFKKKGKKPRPLQKAQHEIMLSVGHKVLTIDNIQDGEKAILEFIDG